MSNKPIFKSVLTGVAILMAPVYAHAFGLGNIKVSSALNTPFRAEIPVISFRAGDKDSFTVSLASGNEFVTAGLERSSALTQLRFKVVHRNGGAFIQVSSSQPMKEPFLSFLVSATTTNNKLLREYTVLLDPPTSIYTPAPVPTPAPQARRVTPPAPTSTQSAAVAAKPRTGSMAGASSYGQVRRGDSLWNVALKVRPDSSVSHEQVMMAIVNANPDAFIDRNINGLKAGQKLHIPAKSEIIAISKQAANSEVKAQHAAWRSKNSASTTDSNTLVTQTSATDSASSQEPVEAVVETEAAKTSEETADGTHTAPETQAPAKESEAEARLALSTPSDTDLEAEQELVASGNDQIQKVNEQLSLAQERIEAIAQERVDLEMRVATMLSKIETLERAISVKNPEMAQLQSSLEEDAEVNTMTSNLDTTSPAASIEETSTMAVGDAIDDTPFPPVLPIEQTQAGQFDTPIVSAEAEVTAVVMDDSNTTETLVLDDVTETPVLDDVTETPVLDDAADSTPVLTTTEPVESVSLIGKIIGLLKMLLLPLLLGLAGLMGWLFWRSRNQEVGFDDVWHDTESSDSVNKVAEAVETQTKSSLTDVKELSGVEVETNSGFSDLMLEADTYINYENYTKAKTVLESAREIEPDNVDATEKLLFVLHQQKDKEGFAALAASAGSQLKEKSPAQWKKVAGWGSDLLPENALFSGLAAASGIAGVAAVADMVEDAPAALEEEPMDLLDPSLDMGSESLAEEDAGLLDFSIDFEAETTSAVADLNDVDIDLTAAIDDVQDEAMVSLTDTTLDEASTEEASLTLELPETDDIVDGGLDDFATVDEATTKLDLAAAYLDMDEKDGARAILEEVLEEGNAAQQAQAKKLLDNL